MNVRRLLGRRFKSPGGDEDYIPNIKGNVGSAARIYRLATRGKRATLGTNAAFLMNPSKIKSLRLVNVNLVLAINKDGTTQGGSTYKSLLRGEMHYLRNGKDGRPDHCFTETSDIDKGIDTVKRMEKDSHHYRFIIHPYDGHKIEDMKGLTREIMRHYEENLGTKLDWYAAVHESPTLAHEMNKHVHVVMRACDDKGAEFFLSKEFKAKSMKLYARQAVTDILGPLTTEERKHYKYVKEQMDTMRKMQREHGMDDWSSRMRDHDMQKREMKQARRIERHRSMSMKAAYSSSMELSHNHEMNGS